MGLADVTGLRLPYERVAAGGRVHQIGTGMRAILEVMVRLEPGEDGVRRIARSDLAQSFTMGQRGQVSTGSRYNAIKRTVRTGALREGTEKVVSKRGHKAIPVELTDVGIEIAERIGLLGREAVGG